VGLRDQTGKKTGQKSLKKRSRGKGEKGAPNVDGTINDMVVENHPKAFKKKSGWGGGRGVESSNTIPHKCRGQNIVRGGRQKGRCRPKVEFKAINKRDGGSVPNVPSEKTGGERTPRKCQAANG